MSVNKVLVACPPRRPNEVPNWRARGDHGRLDSRADGHHPAPKVWRWIMRHPADAEIGFAGVLELSIGMLVFDHDRRFQNLQRIPGLAQTIKMLRKPE